MAHELDRNDATGKLAMFSVKETPWHQEGVLLNAAPTLQEAMRLAGCDFDVELRPLYVPNGVGGYTASGTGKAVVRTDRGSTLDTADLLSVVGDGYRPLQNRDAFGVLEPLLDKGVAFLETGGTLRGGRESWMLVRFDIADPVVQEVFNTEVLPFGLVTNSHSGRAQAEVAQTPIRVVCKNTLGMARSTFNDSNSIGILHRGDARVKVVEAAEKLFSGLVDRYRVIAEQYRNMKLTRMAVDDFTSSVLDVAAPLPKKVFTPEGQHLTSRGYDAAYAAAEARRTAITAAWTGGLGHVGDHSAWEAYNGAVQVIDHDTTLFRTRGSRVASMLAGRLQQVKGSVLEAVLAHCER